MDEPIFTFSDASDLTSGEGCKCFFDSDDGQCKEIIIKASAKDLKEAISETDDILLTPDVIKDVVDLLSL